MKLAPQKWQLICYSILEQHRDGVNTCHSGLAMASTTPGKPPPVPTSMTCADSPAGLLASWSMTGSSARESCMCRSIA